MSQRRLSVHHVALCLALLCCGGVRLALFGGEVTSSTEASTIQPPRLLSVCFSGPGQHEVELDGYGTCTQAHWVSPGFEGGLAAANPYVSQAVPAYYNRHGAPIAYVRGSTPTISARFKAPEGAQSQVKVAGGRILDLLGTDLRRIGVGKYP